MTRKQLIKQLDRIVSGAHDADSDSPRRAEQGRQRLALARAEITAEFDEMRIALKLCRESQQEAER